MNTVKEVAVTKTGFFGEFGRNFVSQKLRRGVKNMRIVVTVVGQDKVGIIAKVTAILADNQVNVLNINQNIMDGFFNMVLIADMTDSKMSIKALKEKLDRLSEEIGLEIRVQSEDIFTAMHQI